ncbi:MAG: AraC family ligand binding domain-containing protein [Byssovorax sp.]
MELIREPIDGDTLDCRRTMYPCTLTVHRGGARKIGSPTSTSYGFVVSGEARLRSQGFDLRAGAGTFFCIPDELELEADDRVVVMERYGFRGLLTAGRIEPTGRLSYIDGCSDTILVSPPRWGDSVLNHLHFPRGIDQSQHTHPSVRLGVVARGEGIAYSRGTAGKAGWEQKLAPGCVFLLHAHEMHSFRTVESAVEMDVIAFHPDSDWGPTDGVHPMLNRTFIGQKPPRSGHGAE